MTMPISRSKSRVAGVVLLPVVFLSAATLFAQDILRWINDSGAKPALAVIEFRGSGSQQFMDKFNQTLFNDLQGSALFDLRPKSMFPLNNPQRPEDLRPSDGGQGFALADWAATPVSASHLVFGYTAAQNGVLVLYGNVDDTRQSNPQSASLMASRYSGSLDEAGAIHVAHEFANDIIQKFGGSGSLLGSRIYFSSERAGSKGPDEIWAMDWDGQNQKQLTRLNSLSLYPSVSPDGSRVAFTSWARGTPRIMMIDSMSGRALPFYNQEASVNANVSFTPDGKQVYYISSAVGTPRIFVSSIDGQGFRPVSHRDGIEVEPKVNPKNPSLLLVVEGSPHPQIYQMNSDGVGVERVTNGQGEATNPAWHPDGQHFAFSWTSGIAAGNFNVFVMDIGSRTYAQLTHGEGRNENPTWAPDGKHLAFMSNRSGKISDLYNACQRHRREAVDHAGSKQIPRLGC
jgi:TolB protein